MKEGSFLVTVQVPLIWEKSTGLPSEVHDGWTCDINRRCPRVGYIFSCLS